MDKIKFLFDGTTVFAVVSNFFEHVLKIECSDILPCNDILLSGFNILNEYNDSNMSGDYYHNYNTIYKNIDSKTVLLSNDGSICDLDDFSTTDPPPGNYIKPPYIETLAEAKERKVLELSSVCQGNITAGVDVEIDGGMEHFSYDDEDQINIKELFDLSVQTNCGVYYHADGQSCKLYTVEQIISIYAIAATNKMQHTTYFNQLRSYINALNDIDSVNSVMYGQKLTDTYLDTYNASIEHSKILLNTLLTKRTEMLRQNNMDVGD